MKYIIDVPEQLCDLDKTLRIPITINGYDTWVTTNIGLKPYTEPDRKAIEDEVWELHKNIMYDTKYEGGLELTYREAKANYEAWKKQKDEIRVGDEVEYVCCDETVRFVVTGISGGNRAYGFKYSCEYDDCGEYCDLDQLRKTGRHFDEVEELLKKMKEEP